MLGGRTAGKGGWAGCSLDPGGCLSLQQILASFTAPISEEHAWAVGEMGRDAANTLLLQYPIGTYLVRTRLGPTGEQLGHALSLRTPSDTKHMKVSCTTQ